MTLTREMIIAHPKMSQYLKVLDHVESRIGMTIERRHRIHFLPLIADFLRAECPDQFRYLEIGTLCGASMCAVACNIHLASTARYAGIDLFGGGRPSFQTASENIRSGLAEEFKLFDGDPADYKIAYYVTRYLLAGLAVDRSRPVDLLYFTDLRVIPDMYAWLVRPGGVVIFDDYHSNESPESTEFVDEIDKEGWNVIGPLAIDGTPTMYVMQKEE